MADTELRTAERRWKKTGSDEDRKAYDHLRERHGLEPVAGPVMADETMIIDGVLITDVEVKSYTIASGHEINEIEGISEEEGSVSFIVAESAEVAGQASRDRWEEMARTDPSEFRCMVGDDTLVNWGLGIADGPGNSKVSSLSDWLDLWLETPEEEFAGYDGQERDIERISSDLDEIEGYTVAYRSN